MMRLGCALLPSIFLLLCLFCGTWAYHFEIPTTITAFQPQTITWFRDGRDLGAAVQLELFLEDESEAVIRGLRADASFYGTKSEGPLIFTATTVGPLTVVGLFIAAGGISVMNAYATERIIAVSPGPETILTPTSSAPLAADSNISGPNSPPPSLPASPPVATDSNTTSSSNSQAKVIGGSLGGGAFLVVLVVIFLFLRRRRNQRVPDFDGTTAVIYPFPPQTRLSDVPREWIELPSTPASNFRKAVEVSDPRVAELVGGERSIDLQQPGTERGGDEISTHGDDNRPVDQASYRAMQAQIQLLMQRVERIEGTEEAPPEYVSAYGSSR
ncbi:hypothetical protein PQX77_002157 [Marasmius sp. AFHP31]|nr:hypothetical protein PQX77_002157 [Marasmius sp. AFHP31]